MQGTIEAELADGTILEFPDNTPDDVIDRTVKAHIAQGLREQDPAYRARIAQGNPQGKAVEGGFSSPAIDALYGPNNLLGSFGKATFPGAAQDSSPVARFGGSFAEMLDPGNIMTALAHPLNTVSGMRDAMLNEGRKAQNAPTWSEAIGHGVASGIPIMGPMAANIGEQAGSGDIAGAAGSVAGLAAPNIAGKVSDVVGPGLKNWAESQYTKILKPTGREDKVLSRRVVPQLLNDETVIGSKEGLQQTAEANVKQLGAEKGAAVTSHGTDLKATQELVTAIDKSLERNKVVIPRTSGQPNIVNPTAYKAAQDLKDIVSQFGPQISTQSLDDLKQSWDTIVASESQGFTRETLPIPTKIRKSATDAARRILNTDYPDINKLNEEMSYWKQVNTVLNHTILRLSGQSPALGEQIAGAAGGSATGAAALMLGHGAMAAPEAAAAAAATALLTKALRSDAWRSVSAVVKNDMAKLLANGDVRTAASLATRATAALSPAAKPQGLGR